MVPKIVWSAVLVLLCALALPIGASVAGQATISLCVDDVIKMVQVKLADDLVISQIRRNSKSFVLSADELVRLKTAGASDEVIRAMLNPREVPPTPSDKSLPPTSTAAADRP